jgi:hypothetical protein
MKTIDYNQQTIKVISELIVKNLTIDLLPKKWINRNRSNTMFGHCHNASGCLYRVFGPKALHMYRGLDDEGIWHWWVVDKDNVLIDLTSDQYISVGRIPPYNKSEKAGMLGFEYKKRVMRLYNRVMEEYESSHNN